MRHRPTTLTSIATGFRLLLCGAMCACLGAGTARANSAAPLQQARLALQHYDLSSRDSDTLAALAQMTTMLRNEELSTTERDEVRFLRAAAASDLLVLARVRNLVAMDSLIEARLEVPAGTVFDHLDAELAHYAEPSYRTFATQLRAALVAMKQHETWPLPTLATGSGSERDLLFVHAFVQACATDGDLLATLSHDGDDPCAKGAQCAPTLAAFDRRGRVAAHALVLAGQALGRLQAAAASGDPLLTAASSDLAVFQVLLADVELRPSPRPQDNDTWTDASGAPSTLVPDLMLWVGEEGVRYGVMPRVRLGADAALELLAPAGQPVLPATRELKFTSKMHPFIHPIHELVDWLRPQLAADAALRVAVQPTPDTSALMLARTLISLKRAGRDSVIIVGRSASLGEVAQAVTLVDRTLADSKIPEAMPPEQLGLYVRLGGYSLRLPGNPAARNIPRVQDPQGFRFDTQTLAQALEGKRIESSQLTFMSGLASEPLTLALFELGRSSRSLELVLN